MGALAKQDDQEGWRWVQKRFEKLGLHRKEPMGLNIWACEVSGPRKSKRLHGYLLIHPEAVFTITPPNNPYLRLLNTQQTPGCGEARSTILSDESVESGLL